VSHKRKGHIALAPVVATAAPFLGACALRLRRLAIVKKEARITLKRRKLRTVREDPGSTDQLAGPVTTALRLARVE
jgi:hypothetical protein